jgi:RNA chaperone Hfq
MDEEEMIIAETSEYHDFISKLKGKKVVIRLVSGGQPITGTIEAYNPYEIHLQTIKGQILVFKHAIATIEIVGETKYKPVFK